MNLEKNKFTKPKVVVSKCLEFAACRYDGQIINNQHIKKLKSYIDFIPVCPEVEIGMGTPRDTIRIIENSKERLLYQPETGKDFSVKMDEFSKPNSSRGSVLPQRNCWAVSQFIGATDLDDIGWVLWIHEKYFRTTATLHVECECTLLSVST